MISFIDNTGSHATSTALVSYAHKLQEFPELVTEHHTADRASFLAMQLESGFAVSPIVDLHQQELSPSDRQLVCRAIDNAQNESMFTGHTMGHLQAMRFLLRDNQHIVLNTAN